MKKITIDDFCNEPKGSFQKFVERQEIMMRHVNRKDVVTELTKDLVLDTKALDKKYRKKIMKEQADFKKSATSMKEIVIK